MELSPPLLHSYVVKGVTILYSHPVHFYFNDHNQFESIFLGKNKRMMVERSKLRPVNMSKHDATKAIFRERMNMGASMADIQPMEMDMGVTFESVGGVDDHVNSLREMVIFPLLYPEIFSKFKITPPRGIQFLK